MADRPGPAQPPGPLRRPGLLRPFGMVSAALLALSLGGSLLGVADPAAVAPVGAVLPLHPAAVAGSDAVPAGAVPAGARAAGARAAAAHAARGTSRASAVAGAAGKGGPGQGGPGRGAPGQGWPGPGGPGKGVAGQGARGPGGPGQVAAGQGAPGQGAAGQGAAGQAMAGRGARGGAAAPKAGPGAPPAGAGHAPVARSTPIQLAVPSIALTAPLLGLGMDSAGRPELPPFSQPGTAGWLRDSATPGEAGTAVLVGHVDTATGPAVFWNLSALKPGAAIEVARVDGSTAVFTVDQVRSFPKAAFPGAQVYAPAPDAQLRIITCGGGFDRAHAEYTGNVVVFAHLSAVRSG
ncbi:class F sortase [Streptacidiphilus sp. EB129]|uniref:class F sortase n=1 Tax=Streptacidiphilus sp. EB129 TaxID=3156262 RepID=UPI0035115BC1